MQSTRRPRSGKTCSEYSGTMCVCCSRASDRCSSWSRGDDLQDDRPVGQRRLERQERPARAPRGPARRAAGSRPARRRPPGTRPAAAAAAGGRSRGAPPARAFHSGIGGRPRPWSDLLARLAAEADLLVDQADGRLVVEARVTVQDSAAVAARRGPRSAHRLDLPAIRTLRAAYHRRSRCARRPPSGHRRVLSAWRSFQD